MSLARSVAAAVSRRRGGASAGQDHAAAGQPPFDQPPLLLLPLLLLVRRVRAPCSVSASAKAPKDRGGRSRGVKGVRGAVARRGRAVRRGRRPGRERRAVAPRGAPSSSAVAPPPSGGRGDGRQSPLRPRVEEGKGPVSPGDPGDERGAEGRVEADGELGRLFSCVESKKKSDDLSVEMGRRGLSPLVAVVARGRERASRFSTTVSLPNVSTSSSLSLLAPSSTSVFYSPPFERKESSAAATNARDG
jgi:hypothetical protein